MLRINASNASQAEKYYSEHLSAGDYYCKNSDLEKSGQFLGSVAEQLGLHGKQIDKDTFLGLVHNLSPSGEQLTERMRANRRAGFDFTFDVSKSISIASLYDERIEQAFRDSYLEVMKEIEQEMMVRVRAGGQNDSRLVSNAIYADFLHRTTRPLSDGIPDMHLHSHVFLFNIVWDKEEQKYKAVELAHVKRDANFWAARFDLLMAGRLQALGYGIYKKGKRWGIEGIENNKDLILKFSRRTEEIEKLSKELGLNDKQKDALGVKTRKSKKGTKFSSMDELKSVWEQKMTNGEYGSIRDVVMKAQAQKHAKAMNNPTLAVDAVQNGLDSAFKRKSTLRERELLTEIYQKGLGEANASTLERAYLAREDIITNQNTGFVTTQAVLNEEISLVKLAKMGIGRAKPLGGERGAGALGDRKEKTGLWGVSRDYATLSPEQKRVVDHILSSTSNVMLVRGKAGTGKSTTLGVARELIEGLLGKKCFATALTTTATDEIRQKGFESFTVAKLLKNESLQAALKGNVLVVDEAGLLDVGSMKHILELSQKQQFRVVLVGDSGQNVSVKRGDSLRILEKYAGLPTAELSEIHRQSDPTFKMAVSALSKGDIKTAFECLDRMGAIKEIGVDEKGKDRTHEFLAFDYVEKVKKGINVAAVASTHNDIAKLTGLIRDGLKEIGKLKQEKAFSKLVAVELEQEEKLKTSSYERGQIAQFYSNVGGLKAGERYRVAFSFGEKTLYLTPENEKEGLKTIPLRLTEKNVQAFSLFRESEIKIGIGDRLMITQNGQTLQTDYKNASIKAIFDREGVRSVLSATTLAISNGTLGKVVSMANGSITLKTDAGKKIKLAKNFGHWAYGYALTSEKSQGMTRENGLVLHSKDASMASTIERFYVALSRWKAGVTIYTHDKDALKQALFNSSARMSAMEMVMGATKAETLTSPKLAEMKDKLLKETLENQRQKNEVQRKKIAATWEKKQQAYAANKAKAAKAKEASKTQAKPAPKNWVNKTEKKPDPPGKGLHL